MSKIIINEHHHGELKSHIINNSTFFIISINNKLINN